MKKRFGSSPIWPALLSGLVAPGMGQIFNREFLKGGLLLFASIGSFLWFSKTVTEALSLVLPGTPELWASNQQAFREAVVKVVQQNPNMFITFEILIVLVWVFAIVDAYLTARRRASAKPEPSDDATTNP